MKRTTLRMLSVVLYFLLLVGCLSPLIFAANIYMGTGEEYEEIPQPGYSQAPVSVPVSNGLSEADIDRIANVVTHEVGGICGPDSYVVVTYANGTSVTYYGSCILHQIHAQVLLNQLHSSMFPDTLSSCIRTYWASYLSEPGYYGSANSTWVHCRQDVTDVLMGYTVTIPSNVYAATCDPYFASYYPGYSLYAAVYWNTGWYSGTFYYYQYG